MNVEEYNIKDSEGTREIRESCSIWNVFHSVLVRLFSLNVSDWPLRVQH